MLRIKHRHAKAIAKDTDVRFYLNYEDFILVKGENVFANAKKQKESN